MNVGAHMATLDHRLIVNGCIRRAPVRTLAAAATFTRRSLELNPSTLQQQRHLRTGMLLHMMSGTILVQKLPRTDLRTLLVTNSFDVMSFPY